MKALVFFKGVVKQASRRINRRGFHVHLGDKYNIVAWKANYKPKKVFTLDASFDRFKRKGSSLWLERNFMGDYIDHGFVLNVPCRTSQQAELNSVLLVYPKLPVNEKSLVVGDCKSGWEGIGARNDSRPFKFKDLDLEQLTNTIVWKLKERDCILFWTKEGNVKIAHNLLNWIIDHPDQAEDKYGFLKNKELRRLLNAEKRLAMNHMHREPQSNMVKITIVVVLHEIIPGPFQLYISYMADNSIIDGIQWDLTHVGLGVGESDQILDREVIESYNEPAVVTELINAEKLDILAEVFKLAVPPPLETDNQFTFSPSSCLLKAETPANIIGVRQLLLRCSYNGRELVRLRYFVHYDEQKYEVLELNPWVNYMGVSI